MSTSRFIAKDLLRKLRNDFGYTQGELVDLLATTNNKFSRQYYNQIELGKRTVDTTVAMALSRLLQQPISDLFTEKETQHAQQKAI